MMECRSEQMKGFSQNLASTQQEVVRHVRRHAVPYTMLGIGILGLAWSASRRMSLGSTGHDAAEESRVSSYSVRKKRRSTTHSVASQKETQRAVPKAEPSVEEARPHVHNGENHAEQSSTASKFRLGRAKMARTRERFRQNRVELSQRYADAFQLNPLRIGIFSAVIGGILGAILPLSRRERNVWRPLGQYFWLRAQHWSARELEKWDAAVDAHIESPPS